MAIKKNSFNRPRLDRIILLAVAAIFIILPFSTPLSIFLGSHLNHLDLFKVWKEIAMILVAALILLSGNYKRLAHIKEHGFKVLVWLILAYSGWTLLLGLLNLMALDRINWEAFIYALIVNLRFLFFFLLCWLVAQGSTYLQDNWKKLLFIPAAIVVAFGLLQIFILPPDILEYIGYGRDTITAYQTVDQNSNYVRIQSTLRGPNPLGAYLIIIIPALLIGFRKRWWPQAALLAGSLTVLFYSYSRSAWLGLATALGVLAYISIRSQRLRKNLTIAGLALVFILPAAIYTGRDNQFIQKAVFHTDETSLSPQSSNEQRTSAIQRGVHDVVHEPFGRGPGSAGPSSLRNDQPGRIAENYYLQIGQELGWVGLALFLAINAVLVVLLWRRRNAPLVKILLASFAGITLINLLSHAWTDETLTLLWWGMSGIAVATFGSKQERPKTMSPTRQDNH